MNYYNEIKNTLINNEVVKRAKDYSKNKSDLNTYYNVGKLLNEAGRQYGEGIIKKYSLRLSKELGRGYGVSNLKNMRQFYLVFKNRQALPGNLTWSHCVELLRVSDEAAIEYYIDILLYNIKFNCYVVVELKVTELKAEYIGQIQKYMNYIDKNLRTINQDKTIGIIIVRKDNKYVMEYCSDERVHRTTYILN